MEPLLELVLFSDMHAHNFRYGSRRVPHPDEEKRGLYNSRLIDCVAVLRDIGKYCEDYKIKHVLFGGDLFHRRTVLHTDVFNIIYDEIAKLNLDITMIPGNHDYGDRSGHVHSLAPFDKLPNVTVLDQLDCATPWRVLDGKVAVVGVPYTDDPEEAKARLQAAGAAAAHLEQPALLLGHLGMQGAKVGSDYVLVSDADVQVSDVPYEDFTACFFGHYHQHQRLFKNGWFIGATHHHNWGDANTVRGFLHVKVFGDHVEFIQVETNVSRFINADESTNALDVRPSDFVRYHLNEDAGSIDTSKLEELFGVSQVELIEHRKDELEEFQLPKDSLEPRTLVKLWTDSRCEDESFREVVRALGEALIAEAEGLML